MNDDKRLAAALFLPPAKNGESIQELLARAGATDIADGPSDPDDGSHLVYCRWAGMTCTAFLDERPTQRLLVIFFHQSSFLELFPDDPFDESQEPAAELLEAFVETCQALQPDAAVLVTHPHQADIDELWQLSGLVLEADARRLAAERFGLLYVSEKIDAYQDGGWFVPDREVVPVARGRMIFAGKGGKRWW